MGSGESKQDTQKTVESTGSVNNNLVFQKAVPIESRTVEILLVILIALKVITFMYALYRKKQDKLKDKLRAQYANRQNPTREV